jgi:hypothetical protein
MSHGGDSWLDRASKVMSGLEIYSNVVSSFYWGISATAVESTFSAVSLFDSTGYPTYLGEVSMSRSFGEASKVLAIRLVYTILPEVPVDIKKGRFLDILVL